MMKPQVLTVFHLPLPLERVVGPCLLSSLPHDLTSTIHGQSREEHRIWMGRKRHKGDRIERKGQRVVLFGETGSSKLGSELQNVGTERDLWKVLLHMPRRNTFKGLGL